MSYRSLLCTAALTFSIGTAANAATLSDLVAGASLTQGDVTFSGFQFDDRFGADATGGLADRQETPFAGDRSVSSSEIEVTTSGTATSVTLTATVSPSISIVGADPGSGFDHIFDFFLDFSVSVDAPSTRQINGVTLGGGDLSARGDAVSEVIFDILGFGGSNDLEIFEAPSLIPTSVTSDSQAIAATSELSFEGQIEGNTKIGGTAGLSTYSLTFDLIGTAPPPPPPPGPEVVPLPAGFPLLLGGLAGLAFLRRRNG